MRRTRFSEDRIIKVLRDAQAGEKARGICRRLRVPTLIDDFPRECQAIEVGTSLPGARVVQVLERVSSYRGIPGTIVVDNGPEFARKALDEWTYGRRVGLHFIEPGKSVQNAYIESFNGKFRDECLNEHWFGSIGLEGGL